MDIWSQVSKTLGLAFDATAKEAEKLSDLAKAKYRMVAAQSKRDNAFNAIGKLTYDQYKNGADNKEALEKLFEQVDLLNQLIHSLKEEIIVLRNKKVCVSCGKTIPKEDEFCPKCGAMQPIIEADPVKDEAEYEDISDEEFFEDETGDDASDAE